MNVLFVNGGNRWNGPSPVIKNFGDALAGQGVRVSYFSIIGKGVWGYIKHLKMLRNTVVSSDFDLVHAHYFFSGILALMVTRLPVVVSFMGSDIFLKNVLLRLWARLSLPLFAEVVFKSERMRKVYGQTGTVIPNGVDLNRFCPGDKSAAMKKLNFDPDRKHVIFIGLEWRAEKNVELARAVISKMQNEDTEFHVVNKVPNNFMAAYYNAADAYLLTSKWEGSPNAVKEAMACNLPVVATDVGDIRERLENVENSYVCPGGVDELASRLTSVLESGNRSNGREVIKRQRLEVANVSRRVVEIYNRAVSRRKGY